MILGLDSIIFNVRRAWKLYIQNENNVVLNEKSVEEKPCINRESKSLEIKIELYSCYDINMNLQAFLTPPSIYHVAPLGRRSGRKSSQVRNICSWLWTWKNVFVAMLGNTRRSRVMTSISPCTSHQSFTVWTRWKSHVQSQKENWKDQERGWLPLWVLRPKQSHKNTKSEGMPSEMSVRRNFLKLLGSLRNLRDYFMIIRGPNMSLLKATFI